MLFRFQVSPPQMAGGRRPFLHFGRAYSLPNPVSCGRLCWMLRISCNVMKQKMLMPSRCTSQALSADRPLLYDILPAYLLSHLARTDSC